MALGVIDFYSPVAKGFAAGFFCGDFGRQVRHFDWFDKLTTGKLRAGKLTINWVRLGSF